MQVFLAQAHYSYPGSNSVVVCFREWEKPKNVKATTPRATVLQASKAIGDSERRALGMAPTTAPGLWAAAWAMRQSGQALHAVFHVDGVLKTVDTTKEVREFRSPVEAFRQMSEESKVRLKSWKKEKGFSKEEAEALGIVVME